MLFNALFVTIHRIWYLNSESSVRIDVGQWEKIGRPDEEVSVEGVQRKTTSASDSHNRLEADLSGQISPEQKYFV